MAGVRTGRAEDASRIAQLAELKREQYETYAPVFHRPKPDTRELHASFLASQVEIIERHVALVHEADDGHINGFLIATIVPPPPVYDPGGLTCLVDDFVVDPPSLWASAGRELLDEATRISKQKGAVQTVVVCGPQDAPKRAMLVASGHAVVSEWFTKPFCLD
ncbi:MAG: GNAT family N-acetyltransferase [Gaiellaceae bacterium MAG52_C11]|nr:GNAT family N-acetyltransferase [Candidatus Gaiellasilicea maunaloa]